jgi:hypothetical protein
MEKFVFTSISEAPRHFYIDKKIPDEELLVAYFSVKNGCIWSLLLSIWSNPRNLIGRENFGGVPPFSKNRVNGQEGVWAKKKFLFPFSPFPLFPFCADPKKNLKTAKKLEKKRKT